MEKSPSAPPKSWSDPVRTSATPCPVKSILLRVRRRPGGESPVAPPGPRAAPDRFGRGRPSGPRRGDGTRSVQLDLDPRVLDPLHPKDTRKVDRARRVAGPTLQRRSRSRSEVKRSSPVRWLRTRTKCPTLRRTLPPEIRARLIGSSVGAVQRVRPEATSYSRAAPASRARPRCRRGERQRRRTRRARRSGRSRAPASSLGRERCPTARPRCRSERGSRRSTRLHGPSHSRPRLAGHARSARTRD